MSYLAAAAPRCAPEAPAQWLTQQQAQLKQSNVAAVQAALAPHVEPAEVADKAAPPRGLLAISPTARGNLTIDARCRTVADWLGRDRKCASLCDSTALETCWRLVERRHRRRYAGLPHALRQWAEGHRANLHQQAA